MKMKDQVSKYFTSSGLFGHCRHNNCRSVLIDHMLHGFMYFRG